MRNDSRPIGERLRDIDEHARDEHPSEQRPPERGHDRTMPTREETKPKSSDKGPTLKPKM